MGRNKIPEGLRSNDPLKTLAFTMSDEVFKRFKVSMAIQGLSAAGWVRNLMEIEADKIKDLNGLIRK